MGEGRLDVVESVSPERRRRPGFGSGRLLSAALVLSAALAIALAGAIATAVVYHNDAAALRHRVGATMATAGSAVAVANVRSVVVPLETSGGPFGGEATIFTVPEPTAGLVQVVVTASISGGRPNTAYRLVGNDCGVIGQPDWTWASGVTDETGAAVLSGPPRTGRSDDYYWLAVEPWRQGFGPGVEGGFAVAEGQAFPDGGRPCML